MAANPGALGNPEGKIPTLHIDRLAKEGITFTDAHSSSSVCTPTRYNVLTGRYSWRTHLIFRPESGKERAGSATMLTS